MRKHRLMMIAVALLLAAGIMTQAQTVGDKARAPTSDPVANQEISSLREQVKQLEKRLAVLEARLKVAPPAAKKDTARVGQIFVVGNDKIPQSVILKQIPFVPGQVLDFQSLRHAEKNLRAMHATIAVLDPDGNSVFKDILVTVKEK